MIVHQLSQILENADEASAELNRLVDEFREGRDAVELLDLINSASDELVRIGAWMLSEIRPEKYNNEEFADRLLELATHSIPAIRLHSLSALFPFLCGDNPRTVDLIARLQNDGNEGVRLAAEAAAVRLGITN